MKKTSKEMESTKTRQKKLTARATEDEQKKVWDMQKELDLTLLELLLEGARAIQELKQFKDALTK